MGKIFRKKERREREEKRRVPKGNGRVQEREKGEKEAGKGRERGKIRPKGKVKER